MPFVPQRRASAAAWTGLLGAVALMAVAMALPPLTDWNVHVKHFPPLHADWDPRVGPGTLPALAVGLIGVLYAPRAAAVWPWPRLLLGTFALGVAWLASLATVDGWNGIGHILTTSYEYLNTARSVTNVSTTLHEYISRIPFAAGDRQWPSHIAGHPPGALLFFVLLVRVGLGSGLAAGWVVLLVAATTPAAVLSTLRRLGAEPCARLAAPFLVLGTAAIWMAVSADAVFGAVAAWGLCCLAVSATSRGRAVAGWGLLAGLLLGYCVMMSYGLPLLALLAIAVLMIARSWRPLPWAVASAAAVVLAFAVAGFAWWEAYPVLVERYRAGIARVRPFQYWIWGDFAALSFSAGPIVGAAVATAVVRARQAREGVGRGLDRPVVILTCAATACVVLADVSQMSKAEVERIWLPFVPWLLVGTALLPERWRRPGLVGQVVLALVVQHLFFTGW